MRKHRTISVFPGIGSVLHGILAICCGSAVASAAFTGVNSPTSQWTGTRYPDASANDPYNDHQTGQGDSDMVGNATHPVFYSYFDRGNLTTPTDGTLYFRTRIGGKDGTGTSITFNNYIMVGLDFAKIDTVGQPAGFGKMDLFVVCDSSKKTTAVFLAGTGANLSPNTTTIAGKAVTGTLRNHVLGTTYSTLLVDPTVDDATPRPLVTDIGANKANDFFVSFSVPLGDIIAAANSLGLSVTETTPFGIGVLTSTQDNSFNQDVIGVAKKGSVTPDPWSTPWASIETEPIGMVNVVPEPGMAAIVLSPFVGLLMVRRGRRATVACVGKSSKVLSATSPEPQQTPPGVTFRTRVPVCTRVARHKLDGYASLEYYA